jgi:hypothetical protein
MYDRIAHMKEVLMCAVEGQLSNLQNVDTKELGEAIDMIKDLEEANYYCTITEAMKKGKGEYEFEYKTGGERHKEKGNMEYYSPEMYNRSYYEEPMRMYVDGNGNTSSSSNNGNSNGNRSNLSEEMMEYDPREGRSPKNRRMYMESKEKHQDKATQLRELEKYMQELSTDIVEMLEGATLEERQYLEKKMTALATKIGHLQ